MKPAEVSLQSDTEIRIERTFSAPIEKVWRAFTEPKLVSRWMLGPPGWSMPVCEMEVQVGGKFRWRWRNDDDGKEFGFTGEFLDVVPLSRIVSTEYFDSGTVGGDMGEGTIVTWTFKESDGSTMLAYVIKYKSRSDRDAALSSGITDGMAMSYKKLDDLLDTEVN